MYSSDYHPIAENANTVGGLALNGLRNNEANKIVKTDGSGYLQAGWINTPSGKTNTATLFACFNHTNDMYLRYMTAADMRKRLAVDGKIISGVNPNGRYIKFNDGTMICHKEFINAGNSSRARVYNFPAAFISRPSVSTNSNSRTNFMNSVTTTNTSFKPEGWQAAVIAGVNTPAVKESQTNFDYIAIGRWK
jgi:hypothetical protein